MQMCHGKRRCALGVEPATFGHPCKPESSMYLKVIYTCGNFHSYSYMPSLSVLLLLGEKKHALKLHTLDKKEDSEKGFMLHRKS